MCVRVFNIASQFAIATEFRSVKHWLLINIHITAANANQKFQNKIFPGMYVSMRVCMHVMYVCM